MTFPLRPLPGRVAALFMVLVAAGCAAAPGQDAPTSASPAPSAAAMAAADTVLLLQCSEIVRAYDAWGREFPRSFSLIKNSGTSTYVAKAELDNLKAYTADLQKATRDRADQPSKEMAAAVAEFELARSLVALQRSLQGSIEADKLEQMRAAAEKVTTAMATFKLGCPPLR